MRFELHQLVPHGSASLGPPWPGSLSPWSSGSAGGGCSLGLPAWLPFQSAAFQGDCCLALFTVGSGQGKTQVVGSTLGLSGDLGGHREAGHKEFLMRSGNRKGYQASDTPLLLAWALGAGSCICYGGVFLHETHTSFSGFLPILAAGTITSRALGLFSAVRLLVCL